MLYDDVPDTLSQLIRTAFIPRQGMKFIVADFSAIEARVIAWLAGEEWRMKAFANGEDIYCASASKMFGVKLSITLDTLTARILKLSSDSQSRIEPTPFYSWWEPTDCRADSAVTPVAHKISPDHRF